MVNYPRRGIGKTSLERLARFARESGIDLFEAAGRAGEVAGLVAGARRGLGEFAGLIGRYGERAGLLTAGEILEEVIEELDLEGRLRSEGPEGRERAENVLELIAAARDFEAEHVMELDEGDRDAFTDLDLFLQHVALVTDLDFHDSVADAVTLMTLHSAKGLEFPVVFISGLEEGLFPLLRSYDEPRLLEEERRLFYVGITRAMERLYLTHARRRRRAGETMFGRLSTFVGVLEDRVETKSTDLVSGAWTGYGRRGRGSGRRTESQTPGDDARAVDDGFRLQPGPAPLREG